MKQYKIAVFGTGLMGKGIAHLFAHYGYNVTIFSNTKNAEARFISYLNHEESKGRMTSEEKSNIINHSFYRTYDELEYVHENDVIVETTYEDKEYKADLLMNIEQYASPKAIIGTNTSTISISELAGKMKVKDRVIGIHFFSPVKMMQLVEIIRGYKTSENAISIVQKLCHSVEKKSFVVKDTPGFILNRLLAPYICEAVYLYDKYDIPPEVIDTIVKNNLGVKMGPLRLADHIGIDVLVKCMDILYENLKEPSLYNKRIIEMQETGAMGRKTGKGFYEY